MSSMIYESEKRRTGFELREYDFDTDGFASNLIKFDLLYFSRE